jgi:hypothetical protein
VKRWLQIAQLKRGRRVEPTEPTRERIKSELACKGRVKQLRGRLSDVSWFMGALCENIARRSNIEDCCSGRFWETRFSCRDLASESAILICGIYVDLNPIRAGEVRVPELARHTSAFDRIEGRKLRRAAALLDQARVGSGTCGPLRPPSSATMPPDGWMCELTLASGPDADLQAGLRSTTRWRVSDKGIVSLSLDEYLQLLDWTGRTLAAGKGGSIPAELASILDRLELHPSAWLEAIDCFEKRFGRIVASVAGIAKKAAETGRRWFRGMSAAAEIFH